MPPDEDAKANNFLRRAFVACVLSLAVFQFSENTADPDLWGHVIYGSHFLQTGHLMRADPYSWTVAGHEWINHEILAEVVMALSYRALGGTGLLLLTVIIGLLTFFVALSIAVNDGDSKTNITAWTFGALAVVEISFGFAARPQIFTALALALELWLLRQVHGGNWKWALVLPPLFALWINTHGGVIAGLILLFAAAAATTAQILFHSAHGEGTAFGARPGDGPPGNSVICATQHIGATPLSSHRPTIPPLPAGEGRGEGEPFENTAPPERQSKREAKLKILLSLWLAAFFSGAALLVNPYGFGLIRWLFASITWLRPQIAEWNPVTLGWDHAAFFFCVALAAASFLFSRRPAQLWETAVLVILAAMGFRAVRNTPLFCIAALALVPPHLANLLDRFKHHFSRLTGIFRQPASRAALASLFSLLAAAILFATFSLHKERAWTMEVPRAQYPVAAIRFIQQHHLHGNLLVFFDWGEMCLWELPDSRPSIDGRLDTCYPADVIAAHWQFYNAEPFDTNLLNIARADFALLPSHLAGSLALAKNDGWQPVYFDNLAVVLVRQPSQFPDLSGLRLPVEGDPGATHGRAPFPNHLPPR